MKIAVIGSGGWGLAMSTLLAGNGHEVTVWSFTQEKYELLSRDRGNDRLLPGVRLDPSIRLTTSLDCAGAAELLVVTVPSFAVYATARRMLPYVRPGQVAVLMSKGFDKDNGYCLLSESLDKALEGRIPVVAVTGPSHAEEVARQVPTAVVAASPNKEAAERVQSALMNDFFRVYTTPDIIGAELGGAMKNIMALAVGISDGAGYGDNTKALLMTRGIAEMARFGILLGGMSETFAGLSGVGDLIVTCISQHSRNRRAGLLIGAGKTARQAIEEVGQTVEGYFAVQAIHELSARHQVDLPISQAMYQLLFEGADMQTVVRALINRGKKSELEESHSAHLTW